MTEQAVHLAQIGQVAVPVTDLSRALAFYRDTLGMKFLFQVPNLAFFDCAGVRLMLDVPEDKSEHRSFVLYYKVDDIEGAYRTLASRGVTARNPSGIGFAAFAMLASFVALQSLLI